MSQVEGIRSSNDDRLPISGTLPQKKIGNTYNTRKNPCQDSLASNFGVMEYKLATSNIETTKSDNSFIFLSPLKTPPRTPSTEPTDGPTQEFISTPPLEFDRQSKQTGTPPPTIRPKPQTPPRVKSLSNLESEDSPLIIPKERKLETTISSAFDKTPDSQMSPTSRNSQNSNGSYNGSEFPSINGDDKWTVVGGDVVMSNPTLINDYSKSLFNPGSKYLGKVSDDEGENFVVGNPTLINPPSKLKASNKSWEEESNGWGFIDDEWEEEEDCELTQYHEDCILDQVLRQPFRSDSQSSLSSDGSMSASTTKSDPSSRSFSPYRDCLWANSDSDLSSFNKGRGSPYSLTSPYSLASPYSQTSLYSLTNPSSSESLLGSPHLNQRPKSLSPYSILGMSKGELKLQKPGEKKPKVDDPKKREEARIKNTVCHRCHRNKEGKIVGHFGEENEGSGYIRDKKEWAEHKKINKNAIFCLVCKEICIKRRKDREFCKDHIGKSSCWKASKARSTSAPDLGKLEEEVSTGFCRCNKKKYPKNLKPQRYQVIVDEVLSRSKSEENFEGINLDGDTILFKRSQFFQYLFEWLREIFKRPEVLEIISKNKAEGHQRSHYQKIITDRELQPKDFEMLANVWQSHAWKNGRILNCFKFNPNSPNCFNELLLQEIVRRTKLCPYSLCNKGKYCRYGAHCSEYCELRKNADYLRHKLKKEDAAPLRNRENCESEDVMISNDQKWNLLNDDERENLISWQKSLTEDKIDFIDLRFISTCQDTTFFDEMDVFMSSAFESFDEAKKEYLNSTNPRRKPAIKKHLVAEIEALAKETITGNPMIWSSPINKDLEIIKKKKLGEPNRAERRKHLQERPKSAPNIEKSVWNNIPENVRKKPTEEQKARLDEYNQMIADKEHENNLNRKSAYKENDYFSSDEDYYSSDY